MTAAMTVPHPRSRGFTLIELLLALTLMAGIAAILFGSLSLAARSWDGGEAKAEQVADMRAAQTYLRAQLSEQYPQRMWKAVEIPLLFAGEKNELRYAAVLPERVAGGGVYYFRLAVAGNGDKSQLVQERIVPDLTQLERPEFREPERSVLAEGIAELTIGYFGRDANAADVDAPTWRDRWDDQQRLPLLVRIDVKPVKGTAVADARRRAAARAGGGLPGLGPGILPLPEDRRPMKIARRPDAKRARHSAHRRAVAHRADRGDRQQLRLQHARRGAGRAQHDVARAGARGGRWRGRAHGVRALAAARVAGCLERGRPASHVERRRHRRDRRRRTTRARASTSTPHPRHCSRACSRTSAASMPKARSGSSTRSSTGATPTT